VLSLKRYREQTTAGLNAVVENTTDALQSIKDLFAVIIDGCLEDAMPKGCFLVNSLVEIAPDDQETKDIVTESMRDSKNAFRKLIEKAQQDGAVAEYFVNCSSGISISIKAGVDRATCENIVKSSLAILGI
jgi:TetR/AcrR family transcriptional repressor of nem operon